ncbi:MAG: DUF2520 domain-containing protein [Gammaproteobacteria bacterium]|nr:DUF2520 domain-containing protein [Gammaproteobacteria bacterium]
MRQVPIVYLIIGSGRMAKHFCHYLSLLHIPYLQWSRSKQSEQKLQALVQKATHIILLISDAEIETFAKKINKHDHQILIHFSGQLSLPHIFSAHPLSTFTHELYNKEDYDRIPFVLEENSKTLNELLPGLPNASYYIPCALKSYYHAICVLSANFTCILWQKFFHELENTLSLPPSIGLPYLQQTMHNLLKNPQGALTGPLARNDQKTIQANLQALENDKFLDVYQSFVKIFQ